MVSTVYNQIFVFDSLMIRSVPLPFTIGTSQQSFITVFNLLISLQIRFCFYPPVYQLKVGVCMGGIGVCGRGEASKNSSEIVCVCGGEGS